MKLRGAVLAVSLCMITAAAHAAGSRAVLCLDEDFKLGNVRQLTIQRSTVFRNHGPISGDITGKWKSTDPQKSRNAAVVTTEDATFTTSKRCAEVKVRTLVDNIRNTEATAESSDNEYWGIDDIIEYVPGRKPNIEFGKLVDDIAVVAQLREDVGDALIIPKPEARDASRCLTDAKSLAAQIGGGIGRQTSSVVIIGHPAAQEMSLDCNFEKPSILVSWDNRAKPSRTTLQLIAKSGSLLTGASQDEIKTLVTACVTDALKPENNELANHEIDGVRAECQSFTRDGGAGSVTILRRFGLYPPIAAPNAGSLRHLDRETERGHAAAQRDAEGSEAFAKWWMDRLVPTNVKSTLMLVARMEALGERCPAWKPSPAKISAMTAAADIEPRDIRPGGRYWDTYAMLVASMVEGTQKESVQAACEAAQKYGR
jgi:hypothetical protein